MPNTPPPPGTTTAGQLQAGQWIRHLGTVQEVTQVEDLGRKVRYSTTINGVTETWEPVGKATRIELALQRVRDGELTITPAVAMAASQAIVQAEKDWTTESAPEHSWTPWTWAEGYHDQVRSCLVHHEEERRPAPIVAAPQMTVEPRNGHSQFAPGIDDRNGHSQLDSKLDDRNGHSQFDLELVVRIHRRVAEVAVTSSLDLDHPALWITRPTAPDRITPDDYRTELDLATLTVDLDHPEYTLTGPWRVVAWSSTEIIFARTLKDTL